MSSIRFSIFGYFCRLGYCGVLFSLTLLLLYKIGQVQMFATKTVGSCVLCITFRLCLLAQYVIFTFGFPVRTIVQSFWLDHFDTVTI